MNEITVIWEPDEGAYIVWQDSTFIGDFEDLRNALSFALEVGEACDQRVIVEAIDL